MALMKCPECASDVSDRALACPCCGHPLQQEQSPSSSRSAQPVVTLSTPPPATTANADTALTGGPGGIVPGIDERYRAKMRRAGFIGMGLAPALLLVVGLTGQWGVAGLLAVVAVCVAALLADRATAERNRARSGGEDQAIKRTEAEEKKARERTLTAEKNTRRVEASKPENRRLWVKEYRNAKEFDKDGQRMVADGWSVGQQSQGSTHMNLGRTVISTVATGGLNLLTPKVGGASYTKGKITVTWVRPVPDLSAPS